MDSHAIIIATVQTSDLTQKLREAFWTAYGGPLKIVAVILLCIVILGPLLAFLRRLVR